MMSPFGVRMLVSCKTVVHNLWVTIPLGVETVAKIQVWSSDKNNFVVGGWVTTSLGTVLKDGSIRKLRATTIILPT